MMRGGTFVLRGRMLHLLSLFGSFMPCCSQGAPYIVGLYDRRWAKDPVVKAQHARLSVYRHCVAYIAVFCCMMPGQQ